MERQPGVLLRLGREAQQDADHDEEQRPQRDGKPQRPLLAVAHLVARKLVALFLIFAGARLVAPGLHVQRAVLGRRLSAACKRCCQYIQVTALLRSSV